MTIADGRRLTPDSTLSADVAVVGAGPVGIAIALSLADAGHQTLLLESGRAGFDQWTQRLGDTAGHDPHHVTMELATRRETGGASNIWGGRCVPFDPVDFEQRDVAPEAMWPVGYEELAPYFPRACEWCVCGDAVFDAHRIKGLSEREIVPGFVDGDVRASSLERWSLPTNFGRVYRRRISRSTTLSLVEGLTVTEIVCRSSERSVDHLEARTMTGMRVTVQAAKYVIACGGLEGTRLLFVSDRHHTGGLGNHSGHLGRWYMAHVEARIAEVQFTTPPSLTIYGHERDSAGVYVRRRFTFSSALQRQERLSNAALWLVNPPIAQASHGSGVLSFVYLALNSPLGHRFVAEGIRRAHVESDAPVSIWQHVRNILRHPWTTACFASAFGYQRYLRRGRKVPGFFVQSASNRYLIQYHGEHLPSYASHVRPSAEMDALGVRRLETHLCLGDEDVASIQRAHRCLDAALRRQGLGRLEITEPDPADLKRSFLGGYHQAGTTRMSKRPEDGVVDPQLAVHGFNDLFIASSSTFVTSSQANSTFMAIVLALRLAEHLDAQLTRQGTTLSTGV